ncbi:response regulator [bacterium]|nr:response regulator [bacterium]
MKREPDPPSATGTHRIPTAGQLTCHAAVIDSQVRTSSVAERFEQQPALPGVIVLAGGKLLGLIPRARFLERLSHKFWPELFLPRPVSQVTEVLRPDPLQVNEDCSIAEASHLAMQRPGDAVFEPIVVHRRDGSFELLDVHTLMVEQTRLLEIFNQQAQTERVTAEAANESKSRFLANMSHEIRTPLTAIIGFGEELLDPALSATQRSESVDLIVRNGKHLLELVNEILDLSKIEAGRLDVELVPVSVREMVNDVIAALRIRAKEKHLDLRVDYATAIPDRIRTDPTRIRQILMNLLGNALKFTEAGSVTVTIRMKQQVESLQLATEGTLLDFDVTDTGIGIAERDISKLFQPFTQADVTTTRRFGGTGLGLTISRRLAELLGGGLTVRSEVGVGSTFTVSIATGPLLDVRLLDQRTLLQSEARTLTVLQPEQQTLTARVLLVDDAPDNRLLVSRILQKYGAIVETAENGRDGADKAWLARAEGQPFDVVLMDMQMPVLDGFGATRELRSRGYELPIVALTANAQPVDLQRCQDAGCDAHAAKPIDRVALLRTINELTQRATSAPLADETESPPGSVAAQSAEPLVGAESEKPDVEDGDEEDTTSSAAVDRTKALHRMGGSIDLVREVAGLVIELLPAWLAEMERNLQTGDFTNLKRLAHTLKTSADNVGASALAETAWQLESHLRESRIDKVEQLLQLLTQHAAPTLSELEEWLAETAGAVGL